MNTNLNQITFINQISHQELYQIAIPQTIHGRQNPLVIENLGFLIYIDTVNQINVMDFKEKNKVISTNQVNLLQQNFLIINILFQKKLNYFVAFTYTYYLQYDSEKQIIFIQCQTTFNIYNLKTFSQEYAFGKGGLFKPNINYQQSIITISNENYIYKINYNYILKGISKKIQNINIPKILQLDFNKFLFLDQINQKITFFNNSVQTSQLSFTYQNSQILRSYVANNKQTSVFIIQSNIIYKISIDINLVMRVEQSSKIQSTILQEIMDSDDGVYFLCQNKKLIMIGKNTEQIQIKDLFILQFGICKFIIINKKLIFSNYASPIVFNILDLETLTLKTTPISEIPLNLKQISSSYVLILFSKSLVIMNVNSLIIEKQEQFKMSNDVSIVVDYLYNRIYLIDAIYFTRILNYDLKIQTPISQIVSFNSKLKLDNNFLFIISTHQVSLFSRKDLQYLQIFRDFDTSFTLKDITYIGISYIFFVEFETKFSLFEISPFQNQNQEKFSFSIENYIITNKQITKAIQNDEDYIYNIQITGFSNEGYFSYSVALNIYDSIITHYCSFYLNLPSNDVLLKSTSLKLNNQLRSLNKKLTMLNVYVNELQKIKIPDLLPSNLNSNFDLSYISSNDEQNQQELLGNIDFKSNFYITTLYFKNILFYSNSQDTNQILINQQNILQLKKILITNIALRDIVLIIKDINIVIIENLIIETNKKEYETTIQITNVQQVIINQLNIQNQSFISKKNLIQFQNCQNIIIDGIIIQNTTITNENDSIVNIIQILNSDTVKISNMLLVALDTVNLKIMNISEVKIFLEINNILFKDIKCKSLKNQSQTTIGLFIFNIINQLKIQKFNAQNLDIVSVSSINILLFIQIEISILLNNFKLQDIDFNSKMNDSYLFQIQASNSSNLQKILIQNIKYLGFFNFDIKESKRQQLKNTDVTLLNIQIFNSFQDHYFIKIIAVSAVLQQILIQSVKSSQLNHVDKIVIVLESDLKVTNVEIEKITQSIGNLIRIDNCENVLLNSIQLSNVLINQQGSCLKIYNSMNVHLSQIQVLQNKSNSDGVAIYVVSSKNVKIEKSIFLSNQSISGSGGAIVCEDSYFQSIENNIFNDNQAYYGSGGAIYLNNCEIKQLKQNQFIKNKAFIGGSIRYVLKKPFIFLENLDNIKKQNKFYKNFCKSFGQDIGSYPYILDVKNSFEDDDQQTIVTIQNIQSGSKAEEPIMLRFVDEEMREVTFFDLELPEFSLISKNLKQEFNQYHLIAESTTIGLLGEVNQYYHYQTYAFVFDLAYSLKPEGFNQLIIKSAQSLPQFQSKQQDIIYLLYEKKINLQFRKCERGEVIQSQGKFVICYTCDSGYYNLRDPYEQDNNSCKKCPAGALNCEKDKIEIKNGYWRSNNSSDYIIQCVKAQIYCQPEQKNNIINGCTPGHIGPRCEECDTRGKYWNKTYGKNADFSCMDCSLFQHQDNIVKLLLIFGLVVAYAVFQIYKKISTSQRIILAYYLKKMRIIDIKNYNKLISSYMKILTSYFQFITIITSFDVKVPIYLNNLNIFGGDTSSQTLSRIDCLLFQIKLDYPDYIVRLLWINLQPIFIFMGSIFAISIVLRVRNIKQNSQQIISSCIFIYMFFQPAVMKVISQTFTCERIAGEYYVISDLTQSCYDESHQHYILTFGLPIIFFWLILVPGSLFYRLRANKDRFDNIYVIYKYGYLYQEYRQDRFYWDLIRLILRSFLIVLVNLVRSNTQLQGLVFVGILYFYQFFQKMSRPYVYEKLNVLERESCFVSLLTIYIIFLSFFFDNILINIVAGILISLMVIFIISKPVRNNEKNRNAIEKLLMYMKNKHPTLFSWVKVVPNQRQCQLNWMKVRQVLKTTQMTYQCQKELQKQIFIENIKEFNDEKYLSPKELIEVIIFSVTEQLKNNEFLK